MSVTIHSNCLTSTQLRLRNLSTAGLWQQTAYCEGKHFKQQHRKQAQNLPLLFEQIRFHQSDDNFHCHGTVVSRRSSLKRNQSHKNAVRALTKDVMAPKRMAEMRKRQKVKHEQLGLRDNPVSGMYCESGWNFV